MTTRLAAATTSEIMGYMALNLGGSAANVYTVSRTALTSTGPDTESGAGFQPMFLLAVGSAVVTTANSNTQGGSMSIGMTDGTNTHAISYFSEDIPSAADNSDTATRMTNTQFLSANLHTGAINWEATFTSFNTNGWTINYGDAAGSAYLNAFLAIGNGGGGTWAQNQDTKFTNFPQTTIYRLRFEVSNEGGNSSGALTYQLQVAETATCSAGSYAAVPTDTSGDWQIVDSTYITDGEDTYNINPGLTDEATTFVTGDSKDTGNTTGSITLAGDNFTEIEFSLQATTNSTVDGNYCFRLTNINNYSVYAEAVVVPEYTWLLFGLGPVLPGIIGRLRQRRRNSV